MKRHNFKFEKILKIKEDVESKIKLEYANVLQQKMRLQNENDYLLRSFLKDREKDIMSKTSGDKLIYSDIYFEAGFNSAVDIRVEKNNETISDLDAELAKIKERLTKATIEKKMFEKLKEKSLERFKKEVNQLEIKNTDEAGGVLTRNNMNAAGAQ
ncbi:MAG TPA: flagellar FliJ family protein [Spirochaetota bacterium]|nr:flagellar FliJ family protein [Spirochaetota bacterium]HOS32455.1 flagellar FliJ family protein [Spirochaetota bacterium]HOS55882.1 flagellar FliJ family protein [Spirochaetota bacterium]HPK62989.1 flagellar FliJ family protein [Spirochaetota bacterium]HQF77464.1 flagellar FliJ family protein [Spirochaetota bacterium]